MILGFLKKELLLVFCLFVLFVGLRLPNLTSAPYHQDEYKWVQYSHPEIIPPGTVPHPPLTEFIYTRIGPIVGDSNFRVIPFVFSCINFFLLFYLVSVLSNRRVAYLSLFLFTVSFYSVLASRMVDVDGAVMPFFFLLLCIGYIKSKQTNFKNYWWSILALVGAIGGFMIKMSGLLPIIAVALDMAVYLKVFSDKKRLLKYILISLGGLGVLVLLLLSAKFVFPFFNLSYAIGYWEHFVNFANFFGRGWFQTGIQIIKSMLFLSPLLLLPVLFVDRDIIIKTRLFLLFILIGLCFYIVAFDFSIGALDRYMQFLIIPLSIIAALVYEKYITGRYDKKVVGLFLLLALVVFLVQFVTQGVPPLHPKSEWIARILSLRWNFVYPFSGGSGPLGFYISFAFIGYIWLASIVSVLCLFLFRLSKKDILLGIVVLGCMYNLVFIEEYTYGRINGSASLLVNRVSKYIGDNSEVKKVTVYNDNGGWDVQETGKYRKRLYIDPAFDIKEKINTINQYKEHYLVVNIPHIDDSTEYAKFFKTCSVGWYEVSGYIDATLYDCRKAPDYILK